MRTASRHFYVISNALRKTRAGPLVMTSRTSIHLSFHIRARVPAQDSPRERLIPRVRGNDARVERLTGVSRLLPSDFCPKRRSFAGERASERSAKSLQIHFPPLESSSPRLRFANGSLICGEPHRRVRRRRNPDRTFQNGESASLAVVE